MFLNENSRVLLVSHVLVLILSVLAKLLCVQMDLCNVYYYDLGYNPHVVFII